MVGVVDRVSVLNQAVDSAPRDSARWFAVHTLPNREFGALAQLGVQGFESFLPTHWKTVRHARQFRQVKAAFFPRYLFVRLDLDRDRWRSVNGTFGVSGLIMEGERPKPVPHGIVECLADMSAAGVLSFSPVLEPGQDVKILSGPFASLVGTLQRIDAPNRVRVLLDILGSRIAITTSGSRIAPVS